MELLKKGSKGSDVVKLQEALVKLGFNVVPDGDFGNNTDKAVKEYQKNNGLVSDGIVGPDTYNEICCSLYPGMMLSEDDYRVAADDLGIEIPVIKAFSEVESGGRSGFVSLNKPAILFEGHIFWKQLSKNGLNPERLSKGNEDILFKSWNKNSYKGGIKEYSRLDRAVKIDRRSAYESISSGKFQILGNNAVSLGYSSAENMYNNFCESELNQLMGFVKFIKNSNSLHTALKRKDWRTATKLYNGSGQVDIYSKRLEIAYNKYK